MSDDPPPLTDADAQRLAPELHAAFESLPHGRKQALADVPWQGTVKDLATSLGVSEAAAIHLESFSILCMLGKAGKGSETRRLLELLGLSNEVNRAVMERIMDNLMEVEWQTHDGSVSRDMRIAAMQEERQQIGLPPWMPPAELNQESSSAHIPAAGAGKGCLVLLVIAPCLVLYLLAR